jgi:F-box protein 20
MPQITQTPSQMLMSQKQSSSSSSAAASTAINNNNNVNSNNSSSNSSSSNNLANPGQIIHNPLSQPPLPILPPQLDVLSVSSKKLCSYCNHELGSGAAMIIENLGLFYHIDCFKCSVCQTPIADGNIHGTDVRVRNSRLHCANCFSNEEGIKFSCV